MDRSGITRLLYIPKYAAQSYLSLTWARFKTLWITEMLCFWIVFTLSVSCGLSIPKFSPLDQGGNMSTIGSCDPKMNSFELRTFFIQQRLWGLNLPVNSWSMPITAGWFGVTGKLSDYLSVRLSVCLYLSSFSCFLSVYGLVFLLCHH